MTVIPEQSSISSALNITTNTTTYSVDNQVEQDAATRNQQLRSNINSQPQLSKNQPTRLSDASQCIPTLCRDNVILSIDISSTLSDVTLLDVSSSLVDDTQPENMTAITEQSSISSTLTITTNTTTYSADNQVEQDAATCNQQLRSNINIQPQLPKNQPTCIRAPLQGINVNSGIEQRNELARACSSPL